MFTESQKPNTHIKDQSLSIEVEEWLKHNEPVVLARGQSTARVGYKCTVNPSSMIISEEESRRRIEAQNKLVRERREKKERHKKISDILFKTLICKIYSNAQYGDILRISKLAGVFDSAIPNARKQGFMTERTYNLIKPVVDKYKFKEKVKIQKPRPRNKTLYSKGFKLPPTRSTFVKMARIEAENNGHKTFIAPCVKHGMTDFAIISGGSRCVICRKDLAKKNNDKRKTRLQNLSK